MDDLAAAISMEPDQRRSIEAHAQMLVLSGQSQSIPALIGCIEQLARQVEQLHQQQQQQAELLQQWADYMTQYIDGQQ